jgi:drug/metabolite transporter (DMT)-like permease
VPKLREIDAEQVFAMTGSRPHIDWRVHVALLWVQVTFGGSHVFGKYVLEHLHPLAVAGIRVLGATPLLMLLAWRVDRVLPKKRDWPALIGLGFLGIFANQLLFIFGLKHTTATNAAILMPSIPVFTAMIAALTGVERLSRWQAVGVALSVGGALVMLSPLRFVVGANTTLGNVLLLGNCVCYAAFLVWQRPVLKRLPPLTLVAWAFLFGGIGVIAVSFRHMGAVNFTATPALVWAGLAYSILIQSALNYTINTWAMGRSTPSLVSSYHTLQPLSAALLAAVFLHEQVSWREGAGFALIMGGLALVSWYKNGRSPAVARPRETG